MLEELLVHHLKVEGWVMASQAPPQEGEGVVERWESDAGRYGTLESLLHSKAIPLSMQHDCILPAEWHARL